MGILTEVFARPIIHGSIRGDTLIVPGDDTDRERYALGQWEEAKHPRGQPDNRGEFAPKPGRGLEGYDPVARANSVKNSISLLPRSPASVQVTPSLVAEPMYPEANEDRGGQAAIATSRYDAEGYDRRGFDHHGFNRDGFDRDGFDVDGYDVDEYDRNRVPKSPTFDDVPKMFKAALGRDVSVKEIHAAMGLPELAPKPSISSFFLRRDGSYEVELGGSIPRESGRGEAGVLYRRFFLKPVGRSWVENESIKINNDQQGYGLGATVLARQVDQLGRLGFSKIEATAYRNDAQQWANWVGWKVWPKMGYDGPLTDSVKAILPDHMRHYTMVSDLMETPEGREWWDENGDSTKVEFNLSQGSRSLQVLNEYLAKKGKATVQYRRSVDNDQINVYNEGLHKESEPCQTRDSQSYRPKNGLNDTASVSRTARIASDTRSPTSNQATRQSSTGFGTTSDASDRLNERPQPARRERYAGQFEETKHPRGQPENRGEFAPKPSGQGGGATGNLSTGQGGSQQPGQAHASGLAMPADGYFAGRFFPTGSPIPEEIFRQASAEDRKAMGPHGGAAISAKMASERHIDALARGINTYGQDREAADALARKIGLPFSRSDVALLCGAGDEAQAIVSKSDHPEGSIYGVAIRGPGYEMERTILIPNDPGEPTSISNDYFQVANEGTGLGTRLFASQVMAADHMGIGGIETEAAGAGYEPDGFNGYYTWPRLGYDGDIHSHVWAGHVPKQFRGYHRVSQFMETAAGRRWWKVNGIGTTMAFNTRSGSPNREVLDEYLKKKGRKPVGNAGGLIRYKAENGLPEPPKVMEPHPAVQASANAYAKPRGLPGHESLDYRPLDVGRSKRIADAYQVMEHKPNDPAVKASYDALKRETLAQYQHLTNGGAKLEPWAKQGQPYADSAAMRNDVHKNNHLYFFTGGDMPKDHPLAEPTGVKYGGQDLTHNDLFRAVHDYYGHSIYGNEFGPRGEEHAWRTHSRMFSPEARPAMTTETRGQNSWVNFGSHLRDKSGRVLRKGDPGYIGVADRPYAEQKAGLLPEEFHKDDEGPTRYAESEPWSDTEETQYSRHRLIGPSGKIARNRLVVRMARGGPRLAIAKAPFQEEQHPRAPHNMVVGGKDYTGGEFIEKQHLANAAPWQLAQLGMTPASAAAYLATGRQGGAYHPSAHWGVGGVHAQQAEAEKRFVATYGMLPKGMRDFVHNEDLAQIRSPKELKQVVGLWKAAAKNLPGSRIPTQREIEALAIAGESVRGHYEEFQSIVNNVMGLRAGRAFAIVNSILSANTGWEEHTVGAFRLVGEYMSRGEPKGKALQGLIDEWAESRMVDAPGKSKQATFGDWAESDGFALEPLCDSPKP